MRHTLLTTLLVLVAVSAAPAADRSTAIGEGLEVNRPVDGDAVVIGGDLHLGPEARVSGDAIAILGTVVADPGAEVAGRTIAIRSLATLSLDPAVHAGDAVTPAALSLLSLGGWLLLATGVAYVVPRKVALGIAGVTAIGWRLLVLGILSVVTVVAALVAVLGLGPGLGVPLGVALYVVFIILKAVGLTVLGGVLGRFLLARVDQPDLPLPIQVMAGLLPLLAVRFVPVLGGAAWGAVSIVALGAGVFAAAVAAAAPAPESRALRA